MSCYRSAYEEYYKNINNVARGKNDKNKCSTYWKRNGDPISLKHGINLNNNDKIISILTKRLIKELTGATILLVFFVGLKYIPTDQVKEMHMKCKQTLNYNFNYNDCINTMNTIQVGNIKGTSLQIDNLKAKAYNFIEYIKQTDNMQN
ncbi:hypothetical protein [Clostridium sp.]|uniref:hypothetical protein n=1 Tax=Clostridium sp. TaxID=1506 RepID=UPI00284914B7|nr:hypothetical protein [Clostridium sp.]MDR3596950.1 hypothetical protein [Clostridium sp.]